MRRFATAAAIAACVVVSVAGCHGTTDDARGDGLSSTVRPTSQTSSSSSTPSRPATPTEIVPATAGGGQCVDPASPVVNQAVSSIDSYYGRRFVVYETAHEALGSCPGLMWVLAGLENGTGGSPERVLFFDADGFIRYDTQVNTAFTTVVASEPTMVTVRYRWLNAQDATANPTGGPVDIKYTLSGQNVIADRTVPDEALAGNEEETTPVPAPNTQPPWTQTTEVTSPPESSTTKPSTPKPGHSSSRPPSTSSKSTKSPTPTHELIPPPSGGTLPGEDTQPSGETLPPAA